MKLFHVIRFAAVVLLCVSMASCTRKFDLFGRQGSGVDANPSTTFRFDVTLDDNYLTAYGGAYHNLINRSSVSSTTSNGTISDSFSDRAVVQPTKIVALIGTANSTSEDKTIIVNVADTSTSQLLIRSATFTLPPTLRGMQFEVKALKVLDKSDSTLLATPKKNGNGGSGTQVRDSLVRTANEGTSGQQAATLPQDFIIPAQDGGQTTIALRVTFAGKGLWDTLPPQKLGYQDQDFKQEGFTATP